MLIGGGGGPVQTTQTHTTPKTSPVQNTTSHPAASQSIRSAGAGLTGNAGSVQSGTAGSSGNAGQSIQNNFPACSSNIAPHAETVGYYAQDVGDFFPNTGLGPLCNSMDGTFFSPLAQQAGGQPNNEVLV